LPDQNNSLVINKYTAKTTPYIYYQSVTWMGYYTLFQQIHLLLCLTIYSIPYFPKNQNLQLLLQIIQELRSAGTEVVLV